MVLVSVTTPVRAVMDLRVEYVNWKVCSLYSKGSILLISCPVFEECESNVCENGAGCKQLAGDYICDCLPYYTGAFCEDQGNSII